MSRCVVMVKTEITAMSAAVVQIAWFRAIGTQKSIEWNTICIETEQIRMIPSRILIVPECISFALVITPIPPITP